MSTSLLHKLGDPGDAAPALRPETLAGRAPRRPTVSVIMPCYNTARFLLASLESVFNQSFQDWELLAIDDHSADESLNVLREYAAHEPRIRVLTLGNHLGAAASRNVAIAAARGSYIAFLDSDDLWLPAKLERQIAFMEETDSALSYTAYRKIDENGSFGAVVGIPETVSYSALLTSNCIGCSTAMYDVRRLGKVLCPDIARRQDHGLWLRILRKGVEAHGLNEPLTLYRVWHGSVSSNKLVAAAYQWKLYRRIEHLSVAESVVHFVGYAYRGVRKARL